MKKALALMALLLLASCRQVDDGAVHTQGGYLKITKVEGHEYVVYDGYKAGGLAHHQGCPCFDKEVDPYE